MIIIFDRAHGIDVAGKRSPDNRLVEWEWSHSFISLVMSRLSNYEHIFDICPFIHNEEEPGLSVRVMTYNSLVDKYGEALVISPHCNASTNYGWGNARGFEIFTSRGQDKSDVYADIFLSSIHQAFPDMKIRTDMMDGDMDKEAGFTVITGYKLKAGKFIKAKYEAILTENLFMDNKEDLELLLDPDFNNKLADAYVKSILKICPEK